MTTKQFINKCPNIVNFITRNFNSVDTKFNRNDYLSIELFFHRFSKKHNAFLPKSVCFDIYNLFLYLLKSNGVEVNNDILIHDYKIFNEIDESQQIETNWQNEIYNKMVNLPYITSHFTLNFFCFFKQGFNGTVIPYDIYHLTKQKMFRILNTIKINHITENL